MNPTEAHGKPPVFEEEMEMIVCGTHAMKYHRIGRPGIFLIVRLGNPKFDKARHPGGRCQYVYEDGSQCGNQAAYLISFTPDTPKEIKDTTKAQPPCPSCGSLNVVRGGLRYSVRYGISQIYKCNGCGRRFTEKAERRVRAIQLAGSLHAKGMSYSAIREYLGENLGLSVSRSTIFEWISTGKTEEE